MSGQEVVDQGYARIRAANGEVHDVVFACSACGRRLIWSFQNWKCPCGNDSFRIDTAVMADREEEYNPPRSFSRYDSDHDCGEDTCLCAD